MPKPNKQLVGTLEVSPNPVPVNTDFILTGCGYEANSAIRLLFTHPNGTAFSGANIGSDGCIPAGYNVFSNGIPGSATLEALAVDSQKVLGRVTFEIV